jgi:hypothetical protein
MGTMIRESAARQFIVTLEATGVLGPARFGEPRMRRLTGSLRAKRITAAAGACRIAVFGPHARWFGRGEASG